MAVSGLKKFVVAATLTLLTCSQGLLMEASKINGKYPYNVGVVPLLAEVTKFFLSALLLYKHVRYDRLPVVITKDWRSVMLYPIPSIIYLFHNNVQFYTMAYVDASTYQILGNLKIVTTGFLFRVFLKRHLTRTQWLSLLLLMIGATTSQLTGCKSGALSAPWQGYALGIVSACLSALAGVYTEFIMKKNNDTLYWQNLQLYFFGALFNAVRLTVDDFNAGFENGFWFYTCLNGFGTVAMLIVINFSFSGLFVSWIMKFADTIVKVYATSSAMLLTALLAVWLFGLDPTLPLFLGIATACISLQLYFMPADVPPKELLLPTSNDKSIFARKGS
eukprot:jgi/Mesvir1/14587/Mv05261-RA.1